MFKKKKTKQEVILNAEIPEEVSVETKEEDISEENVSTEKETVPLEDVAISIVQDKKSLTYSVICVRFNLSTGDVATPQVLHANIDIGEAEYLFKIESVRLGIFR
jgi:hypothetical protein